MHSVGPLAISTSKHSQNSSLHSSRRFTTRILTPKGAVCREPINMRSSQNFLKIFLNSRIRTQYSGPHRLMREPDGALRWLAVGSAGPARVRRHPSSSRTQNTGLLVERIRVALPRPSTSSIVSQSVVKLALKMAASVVY